MAKNCDILPTSSIFQENIPIFAPDPGRDAAFVRCVLCGASGGRFPAFPALVVSLKGKLENGSAWLVVRSERVRFPRCVPPAGICARCGALWGCLRRRKPRGGSAGHRLPGIATGHKKSPDALRAGGYLYFFASSITTAIGKYRTTQTIAIPIMRAPPYMMWCGHWIRAAGFRRVSRTVA